MDGLLLAGLPIDEEIGQELKTLGAPIVLIGAQWDEMDSFYWEEKAGARLATEHLLEQGHERIGVITTPHKNRLRNARILGYKEALEEAGRPFEKDLIAYGKTKKHDGFSEEAGYEAMQALLQRTEGVSAVFASSDVQAIGAWQAIREAGKDVPDDFSLVGYDDIKVSRFIGLSSVAQNMHDVGEDATAVLLDRLQGTAASDEPVQRVVRPELKARKSSQPR
jgi:LacI family transcriptional regulator